MVSNVEYFEYILTDSEFEALVLECSLIKQHTPKYNILLKDDKGYHYIKITAGPWPRISEAKQLLDDGANYIGPYVSSWATKESVNEALKIFKLPTCTRRFPQDIGKARPCLNYYIKQCCAPCRGKMGEAEYNEYVGEAVEFLRGGSAESVREMTKKMNAAADALEFERAARIRDRLTAIKRMSDRQKVVAARVPEQDIIALAQGAETSCFEVFRFMNGRLCDRETFLMGETGNPKTARSEFLERYYSMRDRIPPRVCLDGAVEDSELLGEWLTQKAGKKVVVSVPQKGEQAQLVEMCRNNAAEQLAQATNRTGREASALDELGRLLGMEQPPAYIESYDISNLAGGDNVAGMVVFENGRPLKSAYRKFKIKTVEGQDDYASMLFIGGVRLRWFGVALGGAGAAVAYLVLFSKKFNYANDRIVAWLDPFSNATKQLIEDTWQTRQSLYAIGSGGLLGLGLGQSRQKYLYLPEPQNDFIFAIVCEELGFIGALIIIILFAMLVWRGITISLKAKDKFGMLLGIGLIVQVGIQVVLNIAVVTNTIPNTGISLPFFSYGGTSLVILLAEMGVILSISRTSAIEKT